MKSANIFGTGFMALQAFEQSNPPRASALRLKMVTGLNGHEDSVHFGPGVAFFSARSIERAEDMASLFIWPGILSFLQNIQTCRIERYHEGRYSLRKKDLNQ
jgi:hypothetical protein